MSVLERIILDFQSISKDLETSFAHRSVMNLRIGFNVVNRTSLRDLNETLKMFPSLRKLSLHRCDIGDSVALDNIESLKHLELVESDLRILTLFHMSQNIESVKIDGTLNGISIGFSSFLKFCPNLKEICFRGKLPLQQNIPIYSFGLVKLSMNEMPEVHGNFLMSLLHQQRNTLRELHVENIITENCLNFVLENLKLTKLQVKISDYQRYSPYNQLRQYNQQRQNNQFLRVLMIRCFGDCIQLLKKIVSNYPGIKILEIHEWRNRKVGDFFDHVAISCPNLEELMVPNLPEFDLLSSDFITLKTLHVKKIELPEEAINLRYFLVHCPVLKVMTIVRSGENTIHNQMIEFALKRPDLQELCLGTSFEFNEQALNIIKNSNLRKIIIFTTNNVERMHDQVKKVFGSTKPKLSCIVFKSHNTKGSDQILYLERRNLIYQGETRDNQGEAIRHNPLYMVEPIQFPNVNVVYNRI